MLDENRRWIQRLNNYMAAFSQLQKAVETSRLRELSDLEKQGLIQAFEFTHELAWNVLKDYFEYQGTSNLTGSRDATREGFQKGLLEQGDVWMEMIKSRNQSTHTYNQSTAEEIVQKILAQYFDCFTTFAIKMRNQANLNP